MPQCQAITYSMMEDFAYYLEALKAIPEGDGTLLDNCVILGTTDVSYARTHQIDEYPILPAGSAGGTLNSQDSLSLRPKKTHLMCHSQFFDHWYPGSFLR